MHCKGGKWNKEQKGNKHNTNNSKTKKESDHLR